MLRNNTREAIRIGLSLHNRCSARSALECVSLATALDLGEPIESRTVLRRLPPHTHTVTPREKGYVSCNANFAQIQSGRKRPHSKGPKRCAPRYGCESGKRYVQHYAFHDCATWGASLLSDSWGPHEVEGS